MKANRGLVGLLIVVAVAAVVFFVYKYVLSKNSNETTQVTPPVTPPEPPKPPPPPPAESEKLAASAPMQDSIKPVAAGTIEMIAGPGDAKVKEGDTLVRFTGAKALDTEITTLEKDIDQRVKTELFKAQQERDAAIASGNKTAQATAEAKVADRQKSLDDKQGKLATKKSDRDKLEIKSPAPGTFTAKAKATQKVTPTDELGMLLRAPTKTVTFKKADAGPKSRVLLVTKDNKKLSCVVTSADAAGVAIECPEDAAPDGTEVTFGGVDTSPPTDAGSASDGSGSGSATGSASAVPSPAPTRPATPARPRPAQPKTPPVDKPADKPPTDPPPADPATGSAGSAM
jgi:hypothetical protein